MNNTKMTFNVKQEGFSTLQLGNVKKEIESRLDSDSSEKNEKMNKSSPNREK